MKILAEIALPVKTSSVLELTEKPGILTEVQNPPQEMETTPKVQISELIRNSNSVLVLAHADPDGDAIGSVLAMRLILQKLKKEVDVALFGSLPQNCSFLPGFGEIGQAVEASNDLVLTIDTRQTGNDLKLGHKLLNDKRQVIIVLSPSRGTLVPEDVTIARSRPKYDLILILDCSELERIGPIVKDMPDLFYETPTVSIDHHATNSYFAKVNWVDMTATSTAEMLVSLIESLGRNENLLDADVATCLLTGLTTDTGSFQNQTTTPKSLTVAAQLVAAGARQQEIIEKIFRTKPLSTLKLWGKVLSNIHEDTKHNFVWASVTSEEAKSVGADPKETGGMIDELLKTAAGVNFVLLLSERNGRVHGSLRSVNKAFNVAEISKLFGGGGHLPAAAFEVDGTLQEKEANLITDIKNHLETKAAPALEAKPQNG